MIILGCGVRDIGAACRWTGQYSAYGSLLCNVLWLGIFNYCMLEVVVLEHW
jgi:hypothetical protein